MEKFAKAYYDLLNGEYAGINLTRITDYEEFYHKQILDSIIPLEKSDVFFKSLGSCNHLIDIGFGGGFPILPLAFLHPNIKFTGIETRGKKVKVVSEIAEKLGLQNVKLIHARIENVLIDVPSICTLKAVGKVNDFLNKINTNQKLQVYFYKGPNFYSIEENQLKESKKDWSIVEECDLEVLGTERRILIGFENINVPHGTGKVNNLVKLSELI